MNYRSSGAVLLGLCSAIALFSAFYAVSPTPSGAFGIYLDDGNQLVVSGGDILSYDTFSHEFELTEECAARLKSMGWRLSGNFTLVVDGEEVLRGVFVPPTVSRSFPPSQVVMMYPLLGSDSDNYDVMKLQMGYPQDYSGFLSVVLPIDNPLIRAYFEGS